MKHLIVINNHAGKKTDIHDEVIKEFDGLDYEIYVTTGPRSAVTFVREYLSKNKKETVRIYACGGDGTLHEIINGCVGFKNAEVALYTLGTGNDFSKIYGGTTRFLSLNKLINGKTKEIDISKVDGESLSEPWYSINVVNFGFDAIVGAKGNENKLKGKKKPYGFKNAIIPAILHGRFNNISVLNDGKSINGNKLLLSSIAQGQFVGGEYHASPKSDNTDGLLDVVILKTMSLFSLLIKFFSKYHDGKHLDNPKLMKKIHYVRTNEVTIDAPKEIDICVDGEIIKGKHFVVTCMPKAIKFVVPEL